VEVPEGTCSACYHVFLAKKSRVEPVVRLQKERQILRRGRLRAAFVWLLTVVPGGGHLFAGATIRGALLVGCAALATGVGGVASALLPGPGLASPWSTAALLLPPAVVLLATWVVALRGAADLASDERAGVGR
jgi:hypothetical protein